MLYSDTDRLYRGTNHVLPKACESQVVQRGARARIPLTQPTPPFRDHLLYRMSQEWAKSREEGWDNTRDTRIKEYNALFDPNMRHYFETPSVQGHLLRTGQVCAVVQ